MIMTRTNHGALVPMPQITADVKHVTDWPCRRCGVKDLQQSDTSSDYEDYRFTCNRCGHTWIEEGSDS